MVANNWDRESAQLLSRIQLQRKQSKFNQYMGGKIEFSEELKQIRVLEVAKELYKEGCCIYPELAE